MLNDGTGGTTKSPPIRVSRRGGTGHQVWNSSHILKSVLLMWDAKQQKLEWLPKLDEPISQVGFVAPQFDDASMSLISAAPAPRERKAPKPRVPCILELGAGTGHLAVSLALAGWRGILATDGDTAVVRNMKYNVQSNRLGHAVRCKKWSWEELPPSGLDLADVDLVIGADLVYYNRTHGMLAAVLNSILTARSADDVRLSAKAFLLCCVRHAYDDGAGQVVHHLCIDGYAGSSLQDFIEKELPCHGLSARRHPIPDEIFDALSNAAQSEALAAASCRGAYHLYEVEVSTVA